MYIISSHFVCIKEGVTAGTNDAKRSGNQCDVNIKFVIQKEMVKIGTLVAFHSIGMSPYTINR